MSTYDRTAAETSDEELELDFGEVQIADYVVFLLAYDTYSRYIEETSGSPMDPVLTKGLSILRGVERQHLAAIGTFLQSNLVNPGSVRMLQAAIAAPPTSHGAAVRALKIRTVLSRGGTATTRAVFGSNQKARREVSDAIEASMMDDADQALAKFSVITLKNKRLEKWIDLASDTAKPMLQQQTNPVHEATKASSEHGNDLFEAKVAQDGEPPAAETQQDHSAKQSETLTKVETTATEAASKAIQRSGASDAPPTRSEAIGIATAVVQAAKNDPTDLKNVPPAFLNKGRPLDPEQMAAALTSGRVRVAAGAGSGKSTTLVSRIAYLVDSGQNPSRIMATTFGSKAAGELNERIQAKLGTERGKAVACATMHSLFSKFILGRPQEGIPAMGTPEEQNMLRNNLIASPQKGAPPPKVPTSAMSRAIAELWKACGPERLAMQSGFPIEYFLEGDVAPASNFTEGAGVAGDLGTAPSTASKNKAADPPKAKKAGLFLNKWAGNDISLQGAKAGATTKAEAQAAVYYEFYLGLKGDLPNWRPSCGGEVYAKFMQKYRPGGERLGDLDDMLKVFRDILRRDPGRRKQIQGMYDHIALDEAQDANTVQHQIFEMLSEHIGMDDPKKSIWMIGDDSQAIYQFRGAKPELFQALDEAKGWKTKKIRTNYRCPPEVIEAANKLIAHNTERIPMEAQPSPYRNTGEANVVVQIPADNTEAALNTIRRISKDLAEDPKNRPEDYAVLSRTNKELNDFETACIINEIPYTRKGGSGFLDAPESKAVLGYIDLAAGTNFETMTKSLMSALVKPDRGLFLGPDKIELAVKYTIEDVARYERKDEKDVNPLLLITKRDYAVMFAENLKGPYKNQMMAKGAWLWEKTIRQLSAQLLDMGRDVNDIRKMIDSPATTTEDMLKGILDNVKGTMTSWDPNLRREVTTTQSLREGLSAGIQMFGGDDEDAEAPTDEDEPKPEFDDEGRPVQVEVPNPAKGLGAVQFLYELSKPNQNDHDAGQDPTKAGDFQKKITRYAKIAERLRVDPKKWEQDQRKVTDPALRQEKPPCVVLSTAHSVKGLEWPNVTVLMPGGLFPFEPTSKKGEPPPTEEEIKEREISERNLAYVAMTRAGKNLDIMAIPKRRKKGEPPGPPILSRYIADAGLKPGQNVDKPEAKTASEDPHFVEAVAALGPEVNYDRSVS